MNRIQFLEKNIADLFDRRYCILTGSGTTAIYLLLKALELEKEHQVLMPAISCYAPAYAIKYSNLKVDFCDVDLRNGCISLKYVQQSLEKNPSIRVLVGINLYGNPIMELESVVEYCIENNIIFIEDAAQSIGTTFKNKRCGSFGYASILSFGYSKILSIGHGGAILTNDKILYQKALKELKKLPDYDNGIITKCKKIHKSRYTRLEEEKKASIDLSKNNFFFLWKGFEQAFLYKFCPDYAYALEELILNENSEYFHRRELGERYYKNLKNIEVIEFLSQPDSIPWRFSFRLTNGDTEYIAEGLRKKGYPVSRWYPNLAKRFYETKNLQLVNSELLEQQVINFWVEKNFDKQFVDGVCKSLINALSK